ncbi:MAG: hypothetical protein KDD61_04540 [Bdellovibrionales bacterium]|nr:hypothetical protein [Bdellovibrionales bacterium]
MFTIRTSQFFRPLLFGITSILSLFLVHCTRDKGDQTRFAIVVEKSEVQKKISALEATWPPTDRKVCYAVNVTAPDLPATNSGCGPAEGVKSPFVESGSTIEMLVKLGSARKIEVFAYVAPTLNSPCPAWTFSCDSLKYCNMYKVAEKTDVEMSSAVTEVTLTAVFPGWDQSATQIAGQQQVCNGKINAMLFSNGDIKDGSGLTLTSDLSDPTNESFFGKDVFDQGIMTSYSLLKDSLIFSVPPQVRSLTKSPETGEYYGLIGAGELVKVDPATGQYESLAANCPFASCSLPAWFQSISVGMENQIYGLDHGGAIYKVTGSSSIESLPATVPKNVTQVSYH